jgi:aerobic-type carbon monoxide dehydrogenase small subunit (CoxS/CutS family)
MPVYNLNVNGTVRTTPDVPADMPLLWVLRDLLGVTGPKYGCGVGVCGACTSHINGTAKRLCIRKNVDAEPVPNSAAPQVGDVGNQAIVTIEGLVVEGELHPIQQAWIDEDVASCGFCQPGQIMRALALIAANPDPSDADIDEAMKDNVCRCGTYVRIRAAIKRAAAAMQENG